MTELPDMDFETYSEAGFVWNETKQAYCAPKGAAKKGISAVGAAAYAAHPSTEVLCLAYDLKDGRGPRIWIRGMPPPQELFGHIARGGLLEAWNDGFEAMIWRRVCVERMGWPPLPLMQQRDAMDLSRAHCLPGALGNATKVLGTTDQKQDDGQRLIQKFCVPRKPTKADPHRRIRPEDDPEDFVKLLQYCLGDIKAEAAVSTRIPDLIPIEHDFAMCTKMMNARGVQLDMETVDAAAELLDEALELYDAELCRLTDGAVEKASQVKRLTDWAGTRGLAMSSLDKEHLEEALARTDLSAPVRRALEIRQLAGSAGVKKIYTMQRVSVGGRVFYLFMYHGARTGRDTAGSVQPQNLIKAGPEVRLCGSCGRYHGTHRFDCPHCEAVSIGVPLSWRPEAVQDAVDAIRTRSVAHVANVFGDVVLTIAGVVRGVFVAAPGKELICSDYSSIEAVVTAVLAGEQWRIDAFKNGEDIYLHGAAGITGRTYEWYQANGGKSHPDRQKLGKTSELALGFGGYLGAWRRFDKTANFSDFQVKENIQAWWKASPNIVEMWGGQKRGVPWFPGPEELFGFEGMAISAIENSRYIYSFNGILFQVREGALYIKLPSGRELTYHDAEITLEVDRWGHAVKKITYMTWNSNPTMGPMGWVRMNTYGGRLAENIIQATARDIMAHADVLLERAGYPIVLRIHDELVAEVPAGFGSIEEFETIMATLPEWAAGWPIRAAGGWRGERYRKD